MFYGITIQVPPSKKVMYNSVYVYYSYLSYEDQKAYLEDLVKNYSFTEKYYELTLKNTRVHLHGSIELTLSEKFNFEGHIMKVLCTPKHDINYVLKAEVIYDKQGWYKYITKMILEKSYEFPFALLKSDFPESPK